MEEMYIEETNPKTIFKTILVILFVLGIIIGGYVYFHNSNILRLEKVVIELGDVLPTDIDVYVKNKIRNINDYEINLLAVSVDEDGKTDEVGKFKYKVSFENQERKGTIIVKDTKAPKVSVKELTIGVSEIFLLDDFITACEDYSNTCRVSLKNSKDEKLFNKVGTHTIELKISDMYGNSVTKEVKLNVSNTESLADQKETDMEIYKTYPEYEDYDGTITLKYDRAVDENTLDESEEYSDYLDLVSTDYNDLRDNEVYNQEILTLYNKHGYIIGFTVRLTFNDGTIEYVD